MSVEITAEIEEMVQTIFRAGQYDSDADVLHEDLILLKESDRLRRDIKQGILEFQEGDRLRGDEVFAELEEKVSQLTKSDQ